MKKEKRNGILLLIDFENLIINVKNIKPTEFSIEDGFRKIIETITGEIGEIVGIFAFLPPDRAMVWGPNLYNLGFNIISCPTIKDKQGIDQDTTDRRLMELGEWLMNHLEGVTHLCVGSGDKDFGPLLRKAALKGLKRIIVAADARSLSAELIKLADKNPSTGRKMVYLFSPISAREEQV